MRRLGWPLIAGVLFLVAVVPGRAQGTCSLTQITNTTVTFNFNYGINAAGNRIVFSSDSDLVGSNSGVEVFLWDAATGFTQITDVDNNFDQMPTINADGSRVAFQSDANPLGTNADKNVEIFLWDASTGLTQVTNTTTNGLTLSPKIDAAGNRIVFQSNADLTGNNSDGNVEIFRWDSSTGFTQITDSTGARNSFLPAINASGDRIVFASDANPLGSNGDGNSEIFLWDASTGLLQITNTTSGASSLPAINAAGNRIAFQSIADLVGTNSEGNNEIFLWDSSSGFTQITNTVSAESSGAAINAAGNRIVFKSNGNLLGNNSDNRFEVFLWDAFGGLTQVTNSNEISFAPVINAAGNRIAFSSLANFSGSNSDGNNEIFLASCPLSAAEVPAASPLGLGVLATLLGLAAAWTLRKRLGRP
jgi:Tol biopolymer transport system component